jgi:hypothetical protein
MPFDRERAGEIMTIPQAPTAIGEKPTGMPGDTKPLKPPLRLGLVGNSYFQPLWVRKVLGDLLSANIIEIPLIAVHDVSCQSLFDRVCLMLKSLWGNRSFWIYLLYRALDRAVSPIESDAETLGRLYPVPKVLSV